MYHFLVTIGGSLVLISVFFLLMNVSYIFKNRPFRGGCAQNNPLLKNKIGECQTCGRKVDEACKMPEAHS